MKSSHRRDESSLSRAMDACRRRVTCQTVVPPAAGRGKWLVPALYPSIDNLWHRLRPASDGEYLGGLVAVPAAPLSPPFSANTFVLSIYAPTRKGQEDHDSHMYAMLREPGRGQGLPAAIRARQAQIHLFSEERQPSRASGPKNSASAAANEHIFQVCQANSPIPQKRCCSST